MAESNRLPMDILSALDGLCWGISGNNSENHTIFISEDGVIGKIDPSNGNNSDTLNLAFLTACEWGKYFTQSTVNPMGYEKRYCYHPLLNQTLFFRLIPVRYDHRKLYFHYWIYDNVGVLSEETFNLCVTINDPNSILPLDRSTQNRLPNISKLCRNFSIIELKTIQQTAVNALSELERKRLVKLRGRRISSYLGARLACKRLSRKLSNHDMTTPAHLITTISEDEIRPKCPQTDGSAKYYCSVSHDNRFAIAIASQDPIGVDVEEISERVLKIQRYFMNEYEMTMVRQSCVDEIESSLRVWTIKEAVSKALDIPLTDTWKRVSIKEIQPNETGFEVDGVFEKAVHDRVDNHLVTGVRIFSEIYKRSTDDV